MKYPEIKVQLTGNVDGNAFAILAACRKAARKAGIPDDEVEVFIEEATSGSYDELIRTCMRWFDVT